MISSIHLQTKEKQSSYLGLMF